jgi:penicillin-binding protein 1A
VLNRMVDVGYLTEGQVTTARRNPAMPIDRAHEIAAPNYFLDWAFEETKKVVRESGTTVNNFIVRTTIDPVLQSYAEDAATSVVREQGAQYRVTQAAMVVTEPTGAIRAMVGGMDYGKSQFNRAIVSTRQPGSAFKPFVYSTAFEMLDLTPKSGISDRPVCIGNWCPQNYGRSYRGSVTLENAFAASINTVPVRLSVETGRQPIADMAHSMGITNDFPVTRSLALGVASVSVLDMTSAYSVFANGGYKTTAYGITRVTTLRGDTIFEADPDAPRERVLSEKTVAYMNHMMRLVVTSGTGRRAHVEGVPAAGKTGTTSDYRDAWFCGFTGNYIAAVWFGNDDFSKTNNLTGGLLPTITWQKFMAYAHTNIEIKPIEGVDFKPAPFVIAAAEENAAAQLESERPPNLKPAAARKLLEVADRLGATLRSARPTTDQAALSAASTSSESL